MSDESTTARWLMPGSVAYRAPLPRGVTLHVDSPRACMLRSFAGAPTFAASIPTTELDYLSVSVATALNRAEYHERRFYEILAALDERRRLFHAEYTLDILVTETIYEAAAALGAARLVVDEMLHIIARHHAEPDIEKIDRRWAANLVMDDAGFAKATYLHVAEIRTLRAAPHLDWYRELNDYRNVLFHRGWREMYGGYYPLTFKGKKGSNESADALVVPDRASLEGKKKPHQWSFSEQTRLESVVQRALDGLRRWLDAICVDIWNLQVPAKAADPDLPNMFVPIPSPALYESAGVLHIPFFTTEECAQCFRRVNDGVDWELRLLPRHDEAPAPFMFSIAHLEELPRPTTVRVILDPAAGMAGLSGLRSSSLEIPANNKALVKPVMLLPEVVQSEIVLCWTIRG